MNDPRKEAICNALAAFIRQRPGLDPRNYISHGADDAGRRAYFSEQRSIQRDKRDAETLLLAVRHNDGISAHAIIEAARRAYSGRLTIATAVEGAGRQFADGSRNVESAGLKVHVDYCTGQYFPTEYRRAVAAVCASALWDWQRDNMPAARRVLLNDGRDAYEWPATSERMSPGDWLRRKFRQDFGSALQKRWFD